MSNLRVITFNLNGAVFPESGPHSWAQRSPHVIALIQRYAPDIIGFQEVNQANLATFGAQMPMYEQLAGNAYGDNPPAEYSSIFWRSERFILREAGEFWLSTTPDHVSCDWDVPYPLGATWVRLQDRSGGTPLFVVDRKSVV